jgi:putative hemolysin
MIRTSRGQDEHSQLEVWLPKTFAGKIAPFARPAIDRLLRRQELNELYDCVNRPRADGRIWERILRSLNVGYEVSPDEFAQIPSSGPLVVVANHPYGGIEGVILAALLESVRRDVKVMANLVLCSFPILRDSLIPVDPFGKAAAASCNIRGLRAAIEWVRKGGALAVFPAGEVAHVDVSQRAVTDPAWHDAVAAIIRRSGAATIPVYFAGSNGAMFRLLGMVHGLLRTVMLPSELLNKRNRVFRVRVGHSLSPARLSAFATDAEMTAYLRWRTYLLAQRKDLTDASSRRRPRIAILPTAPAQAAPLERGEMESQIRGLPPDQILLESGEDSVVLAKAHQVPAVMHEIGRLREIAFRSVGEGTGREIDLDEYDSYYDHLFVWNTSRREIVGAYRLGATDWIPQNYGKQGLYTSTLFDFQDGFFRRIGPTLELAGRLCAWNARARSTPCRCYGRESGSLFSAILSTRSCSDP